MAVQDRASTIENLLRMTSRLSDANLTVNEANALRPLIQRLLDELDQAAPGEAPLAGRPGR